MKIELGLCQCGCGKKTSISKVAIVGLGLKIGSPRKYLSGHNTRRYSHDSYKKLDGGCWVWQGTLQRGYGLLRIQNKKHYAHRFVYEKKYGQIPSGLQLDHLCRVKRCVNPQHLEVVTSAENTRRGKSTKLNVQSVAKIRGLLSENMTAKRIANIYGVSMSTVYSIKYGTHWRGV